MRHPCIAGMLAIVLLAPGVQAQGPVPPADLGWKGLTQVISRQWGGGNWSKQDWDATEIDVAAMAKAGIRWTRLEFPVNEREYGGLDRAVTLLSKYQIHVLLLIEGRGVDPADARERARYKEWLTTLIRRYQGRIAYYEIGNEPYVEGAKPGRGTCTFTPPGYAEGAGRYLSWLDDSYTAIKAVDPAITVLFAGLSEWTSECYLDQVTAQRGYRWCDAIAFHPYGKTPQECLARLHDSLRKRMANWPAPYDHLPIWITEIGFHTERGWHNNAGLVPDEKTKAAYLVEMMRLLQADGIKTPIFWYTAHESHPNTHGYGLVMRSP